MDQHVILVMYCTLNTTVCRFSSIDSIVIFIDRSARRRCSSSDSPSMVPSNTIKDGLACRRRCHRSSSSSSSSSDSSSMNPIIIIIDGSARRHRHRLRKSSDGTSILLWIHRHVVVAVWIPLSFLKKD